MAAAASAAASAFESLSKLAVGILKWLQQGNHEHAHFAAALSRLESFNRLIEPEVLAALDPAAPLSRQKGAAKIIFATLIGLQKYLLQLAGNPSDLSRVTNDMKVILLYLDERHTTLTKQYEFFLEAAFTSPASARNVKPASISADELAALRSEQHEAGKSNEENAKKSKEGKDPQAPKSERSIDAYLMELNQASAEAIQRLNAGPPTPSAPGQK